MTECLSEIAKLYLHPWIWRGVLDLAVVCVAHGMTFVTLDGFEERWVKISYDAILEIDAVCRAVPPFDKSIL